MVSMLLISNPEPSSLSTTNPKGVKASALGKTYLFINRPHTKSLILPRLSDPGNLKVGDSIIVEHIVDLSEEARQTPDADVLRHLKRDNLTISASRYRYITVIHAEDSALISGNACFPELMIAPNTWLKCPTHSQYLNVSPQTGGWFSRRQLQVCILEFFQGLFPVDV